MSVGKVAQVEERNNFRDFHPEGSNKSADSLGSLGELMSKKFPALAAQAQAAAKPAPQASNPAPQASNPAPQASNPAPQAPAAPGPSKGSASKPDNVPKKNLTGVRRGR
jgi:hypothetical protein